MYIKKTQIHELAYEKLKEMILSGQYKEGDYLPPEPELAKMVGVSRSALRGATLLLRRMGIIEVSPGKSTIVKKVTFPSANDQLLHDIYMHKDRVLELLEVRKGIEVEAAGLAAERATKEQLAKLRQAYEKMRDEVQKGRIGSEEDVQFHIVLAEISGNKLFHQVMLSLIDLLRDTISKVRKETVTRPGGTIDEIEKHEDILLAIEGRDKNRAREITAERFEEIIKKVYLWT